MPAWYASRGTQATLASGALGPWTEWVAMATLGRALLPWAAQAHSLPRTHQTAAGFVPPLENRCGRFHPHPGNATLTGRDGEWEVSTQGGFSAEGDGPEVTDAQSKQANGRNGSGYGCACMTVGGPQRAAGAAHGVGDRKGAQGVSCGQGVGDALISNTKGPGCVNRSNCVR